MKKLLIRLDDFSHDCNFKNWQKTFDILAKFGISACVGVIPDNRDPKLQYNARINDEQFWREVKKIQNHGHVIAMHGYQHLFHSISNTKKLLVPFYRRSEFAGLSYKEQSEKLLTAQELFDRNEVDVELFMAPAHSFDQTTVIALRECTKIDYITDGLFFDAVVWDGMKFIPQQLGSLRDPIFPCSTVCLHPNNFKENTFPKMEEFITKHYNLIYPFNNYDYLRYRKKKFRHDLERAVLLTGRYLRKVL